MWLEGGGPRKRQDGSRNASKAEGGAQHRKMEDRHVEALSVVQQILSKSTDHMRRIVGMGQGQEVTLTYVCPHCNCSPTSFFGGSRRDTGFRTNTRRNSATGGAQLLEDSTIGGSPFVC